MNTNYKRTFDAVRIPREREDQIRSKLSSHLSAKYEEDNLMNTKRHSLKNFHLLAIAAIIVLTLALVGFTYGNQIIQLLGGGHIEEDKNSMSMDMGFESDPVKVQDGQIYFILDGSNRNITDQCSEETYYEYEEISDSGYRHVVLIGGTPDNIGMAEFIWDEKGQFKGNNATYNSDDEHSDDEPMWLVYGKKKLLKD